MEKKKVYNYIESIMPEKSKWILGAIKVLAKLKEEEGNPIISSYRLWKKMINYNKTHKPEDRVVVPSLPTLHEFLNKLAVDSELCVRRVGWKEVSKKVEITDKVVKLHKILSQDLDSTS